jgi:hypothetical protein
MKYVKTLQGLGIDLEVETENGSRQDINEYISELYDNVNKNPKGELIRRVSSSTFGEEE